jgi:hypothetical protein
LAFPGIDQADLSEFAGSYIFDSILIMTRAPVLRPNLYNPVVLAGRIAHEVPFTNGVGEGLFNIHVLAGLAGQHGDMCVRVIGNGDNHAINIFIVQNPAEILHGAGRLLLGLFQIRVDFVQYSLINIAEGFEIGALRDGAERIPATLVAAAYERQDDSFVSPDRSRVQVQKGSRSGDPDLLCKCPAALLFHNVCL